VDVTETDTEYVIAGTTIGTKISTIIGTTVTTYTAATASIVTDTHCVTDTTTETTYTTLPLKQSSEPADEPRHIVIFLPMPLTAITSTSTPERVLV
jgi:hypothetical protein